MQRHDYAFPFRIDASSRQAAQTPYEAHVEQMIRQVLLTSPGERADLPDFGCGLRQLIFAPHSDAPDATTQITAQKVNVLAPDETGDAAQLLVQIEYLLKETQTSKTLQVLVF